MKYHLGLPATINLQILQSTTHTDFLGNTVIREELLTFMENKHSETDALKYLECYLLSEQVPQENKFVQISEDVVMEFFETLESMYPASSEEEINHMRFKIQDNPSFFIEQFMDECALKFFSSVEKEDFVKYVQDRNL